VVIADSLALSTE